jgi:hypothetical protein
MWPLLRHVACGNVLKNTHTFSNNGYNLVIKLLFKHLSSEASQQEDMTALSLPPFAPIFDEPSFDNVVRLEEARRVAAENLHLAGVRLNVVRWSKGRSLKGVTATEEQELQAYAVVEEKRQELFAAEAALIDGLAHREMVLNGRFC